MNTQSSGRIPHIHTTADQRRTAPAVRGKISRLGAFARSAAVASFAIFLAAAQAGGADADKAAAATERGLAFLASKQNDDGSLGAADSHSAVGVSSLAGLAWIGSAAHAGNVERVAKFIVSCQREDGFIVAAAPRGGSMYDHGFATLFLATYAKSAPRPALTEPLAKAVALIVKSQGDEGAWRYQPMPSGGDVSVTACQIMALATAKNAGVGVPGAVIEKALGFLKRCQNPDGGFRYLAADGGSAFPRSAAALAASLAARELVLSAAQPDTAKGAGYILGFLPDGAKPKAGAKPQADGGFFMHGQYYAGQALRPGGGDAFARWRDAIVPVLLAAQKDDGSWPGQVSAEFGTSEACLILHTANAGR